jgi:hypothetical protein
MVEITQIRHSKAFLLSLSYNPRNVVTMALPKEQNRVNFGGFQHLTPLLYLSPSVSPFSC